MKRIIKFTFYLGLLISICFSSLSFVFSNEKSLKWLISNLSQNLGFEIETTVENIDWKIYESQISFEKISVSSLKTDKVQSFTAAGIDFNINFLDFLSFKPFLILKVEQGLLKLIDEEKTKITSSNKSIEYLLKNTTLQLKEVKVTGSLSKLNIADYFFLFTGTDTKGERPIILIEDLLIKDLSLGPLVLFEVNLSMYPTKEGLKFSFSNKEVEGSINLNLPLSKGLEVRLENLNLLNSFIDSDENLFIYLLDNLSIPVIFSINKLSLNGENLGNWSFSIKKGNETLLFNQLRGSYKDLFVGEMPSMQDVETQNKERNKFDDKSSNNHIKVALDEANNLQSSVLSISKKGNQIRTNYKGNILTKNLNKSLESFNDPVETNFMAKKTHLVPNLSWDGLPNDFNLKSLEGVLYFRIDDLLIKDLGENITKIPGLLKLISLFNVSHTFEGLTNLNFKRNFKSGFQSDRVEGVLDIKANKLETLQPIIFSTGSGKFSWDGYIERSNKGEFQKLDFEVIMTLPIKEYLPAYALILGGPVTAGLVYIAGKAFEKPLNKLSSGKWRVSGGINKLKTEFIEWFDK